MNKTAKRILIPVDGSQPSVWAIKLGAQLAKELSARITLLHVIIPPAEGVGETTLIMDEVIERLRSNGLELLETVKHQLPFETSARTELREGLPSQEIVACARQFGADDMLMGSRGRGRWASLVLGSTTEAVIRWSHCPVITVSHDPSRPTMLVEATEHTEQPVLTR